MGDGKKQVGRVRAVIVATQVGSVLAATSGQSKIVHPHAGAPGEWRLIGQVTANFSADHDVIVVQGPFDNFRRIKFKVTAPVRIMRLVVTYDNGEPDRLDVRERIDRGGESRAIDLRGAGKRSLRKVELWYETAGVGHGKGTSHCSG